MSGPARDVFEQYENSPLAPWNEPDDEPYCELCDEPITEDDEFSNKCNKCIKEDDDVKEND